MNTSIRYPGAGPFLLACPWRLAVGLLVLPGSSSDSGTERHRRRREGRAAGCNDDRAAPRRCASVASACDAPLGRSMGSELTIALPAGHARVPGVHCHGTAREREPARTIAWREKRSSRAGAVARDRIVAEAVAGSGRSEREMRSPPCTSLGQFLRPPPAPPRAPVRPPARVSQRMEAVAKGRTGGGWPRSVRRGF